MWSRLRILTPFHHFSEPGNISNDGLGRIVCIAMLESFFFVSRHSKFPGDETYNQKRNQSKIVSNLFLMPIYKGYLELGTLSIKAVFFFSQY